MLPVPAHILLATSAHRGQDLQWPVAASPAGALSEHHRFLRPKMLENSQTALRSQRINIPASLPCGRIALGSMFCTISQKFQQVPAVVAGLMRQLDRRFPCPVSLLHFPVHVQISITSTWDHTLQTDHSLHVMSYCCSQNYFNKTQR